MTSKGPGHGANCLPYTEKDTPESILPGCLECQTAQVRAAAPSPLLDLEVGVVSAPWVAEWLPRWLRTSRLGGYRMRPREGATQHIRARPAPPAVVSVGRQGAREDRGVHRSRL